MRSSNGRVTRRMRRRATDPDERATHRSAQPRTLPTDPCPSPRLRCPRSRCSSPEPGRRRDGRPRPDRRARRAARLHELALPDPDGLGRLSGVFPPRHDRRGRRRRSPPPDSDCDAGSAGSSRPAAGLAASSGSSRRRPRPSASRARSRHRSTPAHSRGWVMSRLDDNGVAPDPFRRAAAPTRRSGWTAPVW